jgi:hypothetical protein
MNTNNTPVFLCALLANALPARSHLPVLVGTDFMPLIWVDGTSSPEAMLLQERLTSLGRYLAQIPNGNLEQVYGQVDARWIYAYGRDSAFFLHVMVDAPPFSTPVAVPALHAEFAVRFELGDVTVRWLRVIAECQRMLLHFDAEPEWVRRLPPLQRDEQARDMGEAGLILVRSSLYLFFPPHMMTRMVGQLDVWEQVIKQA